MTMSSTEATNRPHRLAAEPLPSEAAVLGKPNTRADATGDQSPGDEREPGIPHRPQRAICTATVALFLLVGCGPVQDDQPPPPPPTVVVAQPHVKQAVEWDAYTGRLEAIDFVEVRARVSGYLQSAHFVEGQVVEVGDLLFVIDPRPYDAELSAAQAMVRQAQSQLRQTHSQLLEAKAQQLQTDARLQLAKLRVERSRQLLERQATSQEEVDEREAELLQAQADREASEARISSAEAEIVTAESAIELAEARVEAADLNVQYTRIESPVSGRISRQSVTEGNLINGGSATSTLLTTITSVSPIYCTFDANEQDVLKYIRLAQAGGRESSRVAKNPVFLGLIDEQGFPHQGHMDFVDNRFDTDTATMRARCIFRNDDQVLLPGMFARIRIPGSAPRQTVLIPDAALGTDQSSQFVFIVVDDVIERRTVRTGPIVDGLRVIAEGLTGDEWVVIEGLLQSRPGLTVVAKPGEIRVVDDGLPDDYQPVPREDWITPPSGRHAVYQRPGTTPEQPAVLPDLRPAGHEPADDAEHPAAATRLTLPDPAEPSRPIIARPEERS